MAMVTAHLCPLLCTTWHGGSSSQRGRVPANPWSSQRCADRLLHHRRLVSHPSYGSDRAILTRPESSLLASPGSLGAQQRPGGNQTCHCSNGWRVRSRSLLPESISVCLAPSLHHHSGRRFQGVRGNKHDLCHDNQASYWRRLRCKGVVTVPGANEGPKERPAACGPGGGSHCILASNVFGGGGEAEGQQQFAETDALHVERTISSSPLVSSLDEHVLMDPRVTQSYGHERRAAAMSSANATPWPFSVPAQKTLGKLVPLVQVEWCLILKAWTCTLLAALCLLQAVPQIGQLSSLLSEGNLRQLLRLSTGLLALVAVRSAAQYFQDTWLSEAALRVTRSLREKTFAHLQTLDMEVFEGRNTAGEGDLAYRVIAESEDAGEMVYSIIQRFVPSIVQLVVVVARMVLLSPSLTVATLALVPCMGLVIAKLGEQLRGLSRKGQDSVAGLAAYVSEVLPAMLIVKAYAAERVEMERFRSLAAVDLSARLEKKRCKAMMPLAITGVYAITVMVLFAAGTWAISRGKFSGAGMVSFATSLVLLIEPIQAVSTAYNEIKQGEPAVERIFELMVKVPKIVDRMDARAEAGAQGDVEFQNVSFHYCDRGPWALKNVSFQANEGKTVAIVGPSGGGKTTLAKMLLRLYDPQEGVIFLDGQDIRDFTLRRLRQLVSIVPQETVIFTGNVITNIAYGDMPQDINVKAVVRAARLANAHEFIDRLPEKYLTELGNRGSSLSGGQRQRLSIARAIYRSPTVLVLDEATSALDNQSEKLVREALERLMEGRTVLVIAHRLETIRSADWILYMEGGEILEEGKHDELLSRGGRYSLLYEQQASPGAGYDSQEERLGSIDACMVKEVTIQANIKRQTTMGL